MKKFPNAHLWLLIPLIISFAGFFFSYWSVFTKAPFHQHLHALTASAWYLLIVVQPLLYQKGNMKLHRQLGIIGIFLAGGVVFSAMQVIPNNLVLENVTEHLRYSFVFADFIFVAGFSYAVLMAMMHKNDINLHARYLFSTVFWVMLPALGRLIYFPLLISHGFPTPISFQQCVYIAGGLILFAMSILVWKDYRIEKKVYRAYMTVLVTTALVLLAWDYFGHAEWWRSLCHSLLK
jgi:uncharacterized membrane protein